MSNLMPPIDSGETKRSNRLLLAGTTLGFVVVQLDVTIVNVALQQIGTSLESGISGLQWIVNAYTLVFAALILTAGALGDRFGARRVFIAGFAVFGIGSLGCGLSTSMAFLIGARAFQGIGAAILVSCSLALINQAFIGHAERNEAVAIWAAGASVAVAAGPVIGGVLIAGVGWRSIFLVNLPIVILGVWLVWRFSGEAAQSSHRGIDSPGQFLAIFTLADIAATMIEGGRLGWLDPPILCGFGLFCAATAGFIFVESRSLAPMLPLQFFADRTFSAATVIGWITNVAFYGLIFVLSLFFQRTQHYTPLQTGLAFLPMTMIILPADLASGWIATRTGARLPIVTGQILMLVACVGLLGVKEGTPYWCLGGQLLLLGAGIGLTVPAMTSALLGTVDKSRSGIASGVLNAARQAGSVVGVALFGTFISQGSHMVLGLRLVLLISAGILLPSSLLTFLIPRLPRARVDQVRPQP